MTTQIRRILILVSLVYTLGTPLFAQDSLQIVRDTESSVDVRLPDTTVIQEYANDPDFQYTTVAENPDSFTERLISFLIRILSFLFGNPIGNFILKLVLILLIVALVIVLINQIMGGNLINAFNKKDAAKPISLNIREDELDNMDLHELLENSIKDSDFHAATRYIYLITLKMLNNHGMITWGIQKTNLDYEREFSGHPASSLFNTLTTYYEFVEYGDFDIDKSRFKRVQSIYESLENKVNS